SGPVSPPTDLGSCRRGNCLGLAPGENRAFLFALFDALPGTHSDSKCLDEHHSSTFPTKLRSPRTVNDAFPLDPAAGAKAGWIDFRRCELVKRRSAEGLEADE